MIGDRLILLLEARFEGRPLILGTGPAPLATFPAANASVGDLVIHDDGDELTIHIGRFAHVHIANYDEGVTEDDRTQRIVDDALAFLEDVFADRIEFFGTYLSGGCRKRGARPRGVLSKVIFGRQTYVWSGPITGDG